ncbi:MAG: hypothetical protein AAGI63_02250 [Planctomycetota bacterium]
MNLRPYQVAILCRVTVSQQPDAFRYLDYPYRVFRIDLSLRDEGCVSDGLISSSVDLLYR